MDGAAVLDTSASASLLDMFHISSNQFLQGPEGSLDGLDIDDLLQGMVAGPGPSSSAGGSPQAHSESGGFVALPASVPVSLANQFAQPLLQSQPQPQPQSRSRKTDAKNARDIAKRARDANVSKGKQPNQVKELEALAAQKSEELERLMRENSDLKFRKEMLEKVVQLRDHQLKVMRGGLEDLPAPWCSAAACSAGGAAAAQPAGCGGGRAAVAACEATSSCSGGGSGGSGASGSVCGGRVAAAIRALSSGCMLVCGDVTLPPLDREKFRTLGKQKMMEGWKHFLSEVSAPLLALEADPDDEEAAVRLRQLVAEATYMFKHASLLAPDTVMLVSQTHLETDALCAPEPSHWATVVRTLELRPEQEAELVAIWALFGRIMDGIRAERRQLTARLAEGAHGGPADVAAAMAQLTISPECEVLQALQRSMRREKSAHLLVRGYLFGRTLSALQFVKAAVYSYPWFPDATALVATVAEQVTGVRAV